MAEKLLITFRSDADADLLMYRKHAEPILALLGKSPDQGILTPEQLPAAIAALEKACAEDRERERAQLTNARAKKEEQAESEQADPEQPLPIGLHQRAWPLVQMMKRALAEKKPVYWGG